LKKIEIFLSTQKSVSQMSDVRLKKLKLLKVEENVLNNEAQSLMTQVFLLKIEICFTNFFSFKLLYYVKIEGKYTISIFL
jgi:hypothetical protein